MAFDQPQMATGLKSGADLTPDANQYKFVKLDASGDVVLCDTAGEWAYGVLYNKPNTGEPAQVAIGGLVKVQADAALNEGDAITPSADGQAASATAANVDATSTSTSEDVAGSNVFGRAQTAAGAAAEIFTAVVTREGLT